MITKAEQAHILYEELDSYLAHRMRMPGLALAEQYRIQYEVLRVVQDSGMLEDSPERAYRYLKANFFTRQSKVRQKLERSMSYDNSSQADRERYEYADFIVNLFHNVSAHSEDYVQ